MGVVIGYKSAMQYWAIVRASVDVRCALGSSRDRRRATEAALRALNQAAKPYWGSGKPLPPGCTPPLHVMVSNCSARAGGKRIVAHVRTAPVPPKAFSRCGEDFMSVPEFAFVQLADALSFGELLMLGAMLCGTYDVDENGALMANVAAVTDAARLRDCVQAAGRFRGRAKALLATRYIVDGAASPREAMLVYLLCLPYRLGGYGLPMPLLNHRLALPKEKRGYGSTQRSVVCDLYWPDARIDVEYDSEEHHADSLAKDARRRTWLEEMGITAINVSKAQLRNSVLFDELAHMLARKVGKRLRAGDSFEAKRDELRRQLGV